MSLCCSCTCWACDASDHHKCPGSNGDCELAYEIMRFDLLMRATMEKRTDAVEHYKRAAIALFNECMVARQWPTVRGTKTSVPRIICDNGEWKITRPLLDQDTPSTSFTTESDSDTIEDDPEATKDIKR